MRYWGFLVGKLIAAGMLILVAWGALRWGFARPVYFDTLGDPFAHDLGYTLAAMLFSLFSFGLLYAAIWDQKYRCRTCLRRLRMPVQTGSWPNMFLIGRPRIEYICAYGHGTLRVPEEQISGPEKPDWRAHEDIWKELEALEESKK